VIANDLISHISTNSFSVNNKIFVILNISLSVEMLFKISNIIIAF